MGAIQYSPTSSTLFFSMAQLTIRPVESQREWEHFNRQFSPNSFLQSWNFGQFHQEMGDTPLYLGVYNASQLIATGLFILIKAKRGNYFTCAAGPLIMADIKALQEELDQTEQDFYRFVLQSLLEYLKTVEGQGNFVRIRPNLLQNSENENLYKELEFKAAPMHLHAERTWILDISGDEDSILQNMRKNTRYYVRKAGKDGVTVELDTSLAGVKVLHELQQETVQRQNFVPFSLHFLETLFDSFVGDEQVAMFHAKYEEKVLSAAMINFYGDTAVYHYAASSSENMKIPSAYLLLWEAIKEAKKRGCQYFNLWGIVSDEEKDHPWFGLSRFKKGFGGYEKQYLHAQDFPLNSMYWLNWVVESARKWHRGL